MVVRRHKGDTKNFGELTFQEQAKAMNMTALQFRKQLNAHLKRARQEQRDAEEVLRTRLGLLENILGEFPKPWIGVSASIIKQD